MYPLKAVLIGCDETRLPVLRHELAEQGVNIETEFATANEAVARLPVMRDDRRLFLQYVPSPAQCRQLAEAVRVGSLRSPASTLISSSAFSLGSLLYR